MSEGQCRACGRPLRDPLSQYMGVGPVCFSRAPHRYAPAIVDRIASRPSNMSIKFTPVPLKSTATSWSNAFRAAGFEAAAYQNSDGWHEVYVGGQAPAE